VTAADGAEEYYTHENNKARRETPEEARALDVRTQNVWCGHPHVKIIDNSTGFDLKMKRMIAAIARIVGIPVPLEIERKFLLASVPDFIHELKNIQIVNIEQVYLKGVGEGQTRIRKRTASDGSATYYYTVKTPTNTARIRYEKESRINAVEYVHLRSFQEEGTAPIKKTRYCFIWKQQYFELDVFHTPSGLVLLELELTEENDRVDLPHFNILREVTEDPAYANSTLAQYAFRSLAGMGM
jgi:CYTH domain-containing protein